MPNDLAPHSAPERYWQPVSWKPKYKLICQMSGALGMSNEEIGRHVGLSASRVGQILADPRGVQEVRAAVDAVAANLQDVTQVFKKYSPEAANELVRQMREGTKEDEVKRKAATAILDRAGYTPIQKHLNIHTTIADEVAARMEAAMREEAAIEADYEVLDPDDESGWDFEDVDEAENDEGTYDLTEEEYRRRIQKVSNG